MRRSMYLPAVLAAGFGALPAASVARADTEDLHIVWQDVSVDTDAHTATFTLTFNRAPVFSLPTGESEQNEAFQFEIDGDADTFDSPLLFSDIDSVIRGSEIYRSLGLPVREPEGDGGPDAGGWGPVRALIPFDLSDQTLTFTTGLTTIGDNDGRFRYRLITTDGGTLTGTIQAALIPLPAAAWPGIVVLGAIGVARVLRKR